MTLKEDIISMFRDHKKDIVYGRKGERVKLISEHGNVLIVEGKTGRFPVRRDKVLEA